MFYVCMCEYIWSGSAVPDSRRPLNR